DFAFQNGDSLILTSTFVNIDNPGCLVEQVTIETDWYAVRTADPETGTHLSCNLPIPGYYSQVGYSLSVSSSGQNSHGCVGARFGYEVIYCIGGGDYQIQPFPYEIRNFMLPEESGFLIPEGLELDDLQLSNIRFTRYYQEPFLSESEDVTTVAKQTNGYVILDWEDYFDSCTSNHRPNGGYRFDIEARFQGSCSSQPSQAQWYYQANNDFCSPALVDETIREERTNSGNLPVTAPDLVPTTSQSLIQPFNDLASWIFNIEETVGANADNVWAIFVSPSGEIVPQSLELLSNGSIINPSNGVYALGNYSGGQSRNYQVDVSYTACVPDSILLIIGWDCDGIPSSDQQVLQGGLPCPVDTLSLDLSPIQGNLQQQVLTEPPGAIPPCTAFTYEIEVKNVGIPTLYNPVFEIFLPYTSGLEIDPASPEICYPCNASNPVTYNYPTTPPTEIITTPLGIKHIWDLEAIVADFDASASNPTGWLGESQVNEAAKRLRIRFDVITNCNFIGGDYINFKTVAQTWCGDEVKSTLQNSSPVEYDIAGEPAYVGAIDINIDDPVNGCQVGSNIPINGQIVLFGNTDGNDTLIVALPSALSFVSAAFNPAQVANPVPEIRTIGPGAGTASFQELRWGINAGVPLGTPIPYEITTVLDPTQILCNDDNAVYMRTVRSANFTCNAVSCDALIASANKIEFINFENNQLSVANFDVVANCGLTNLTINNLTLENTGAIPVTEDITVDFYYDAHDSGDFTVGDVLIGSEVYTDDIPLGRSAAFTAGPFLTTPEQTCKLIAFVSGCNCETIAATANSFRTQNAGTDVLGCSADAFTLGCGEDNSALGFTYEWFGLNGASTDSLADVNDPNTTINFTHFNSNDLTLAYVLLTTHPGGVCNSADTVALTFKGVNITNGPLLKACPDSLQTFSGPTGFFNYQWSPTTNVTDVLNPRSTVAGGTGIQTYTLTYNDLEGCEQYFQQSVSGVNCTDLELFKEVDIDTAGIGEIVTYNIRVINQGPNGASSVSVSDTLPTQLTFLSAVPSGVYDVSTHTWTIPGILFPGDTVRLTIFAQLNDGGPVFNVAEISNMDQGDLDSTPNNDNDAEDDQQGICTSVPINIACREIKSIGIPNEFNTYQWYRNGVLIAGATSDSLSITEAGNYQVRVNGGSCPYGNCCPFEVIEAACANMGDFVFHDFDGDGLQDSGEPGIAQVKVVLIDANAGLAIDSTFTDANGSYLFEELPSGNYNLRFDATSNSDGITYQATTQNSGGDDNNDSDVNATTGTTGPFSFDANTGDDLGWDAGYRSFANIGDFVWVDLDQDGLQEFIEPGIENLTVTLYEAATGLPVDTVLTDMDGQYLFNQVPYGDYYIEFDWSTVTGSQAYQFTAPGLGDGSNDSDVNPLTNQTGVFTFNPGAGDDLTQDAGLLPIADIGDLIWADVDSDGVYDVGTESGVDSVLVIL
ncbi:MAG: SdrD B-like domain-containing protein, partial [Bacteroidota bacterium]